MTSARALTSFLPEAEPPDPMPLFREQMVKLAEALGAADRDTLTMVVPLLARLLESPTRRR